MPVPTVRMFGIENNVAAREADFFGQQLVRSMADGQFVIDFGGLAGFVKRHDDDGCAVAASQAWRGAGTLLRLLSG